MSDYAPLMDVRELQALASPPLLLDCRHDMARPGAGHAAYLTGHLPTALHADLDRDLSDLSRISWGLGRHPLPAVEAWAQTLAGWGWQPGRWLIAYDDAGGMMAAARLWWLARLSGIREVAVLDGGLAAWQAAGGALEQGAVAVSPARPQTLSYTAAQMVTAETLLGAESGHGLLLDARSPARYRGEVEPIDAVAGHVPGALNRPCQLNLDPQGRFLPPESLRAQFEALLAGRAPQAVIHMCGSGVTACHNLLAMEHAGLSGSRLYPPSWSGWISEPRRRVATGG